MTQSDTVTPDEVLVVAAIVGDFRAFNVLVERYRRAVVRTAERVVGKTDGEDVAQEAWLLAFKALPSIENPAKFGAWLKVLTQHRALRWKQSQQRRMERRADVDLFLLEQIHALSDDEREREQWKEQIEFALQRLPDDYALALRLRFLDEMPLKYIAAFLDVPISTVKWRVHKGKELLRQLFERLETP